MLLENVMKNFLVEGYKNKERKEVKFIHGISNENIHTVRKR